MMACASFQKPFSPDVALKAREVLVQNGNR
jgi:hypothetical protein